MTAADFTAWLDEMYERRDWLHKDCAIALGVQPRQITRWKEYDAPFYIGLACAAIANNLMSWTAKRDGNIS